MTIFGATPAGFQAKPISVLLSEIENDELSIIDAALDTSPEQPVGQLNGIVAEKLGEVWQLLAVAYNGMSRDQSEGVQTDNIGGITGTKRLTPTPSFTLQTCTFSANADYTVGTLVATLSGQPSVQFANGDEIIIAGSGSSHTVTVNSAVIATGSLPITVTGLRFLCTVNGPTVAPSGQLTGQIPVTGWTSTTNPIDAELGTLIETDSAYKIRQDQELSAAGAGTPDSIKADVLQVPGVISVELLENTSMVVDSNGQPAKSFQVVIWDGASPAASNDEVAQTIWNDKPSGIQAYGSSSGNATDSTGTIRAVPFSRALHDLLYLTIVVTMLPGVAFNSGVAANIKLAIVAATLAPVLTPPGGGASAPNPAFLGLGDTVGADALKGAILNAGLDVFAVPTLQLGFSASPGGTADLPVGSFAIALADTSRITVNGL